MFWYLLCVSSFIIFSSEKMRMEIAFNPNHFQKRINTIHVRGKGMEIQRLCVLQLRVELHDFGLGRFYRDNDKRMK